MQRTYTHGAHGILHYRKLIRLIPAPYFSLTKNGPILLFGSTIHVLSNPSENV
jgi:hypothetical protein